MQQIAIEISHRALDDRSIRVRNIVGVRNVKATDDNIVLLMRVAAIYSHNINERYQPDLLFQHSIHIPIRPRSMDEGAVALQLVIEDKLIPVPIQVTTMIFRKQQKIKHWGS
jgi:hypothetical protein